MEFKEDKPTYYMHCEHLVVDATSLRNSRYRERKQSGNQNFLATWELHAPKQVDMTRNSKGSGMNTYDNFYHAECPICLKKKEQDKLSKERVYKNHRLVH